MLRLWVELPSRWVLIDPAQPIDLAFPIADGAEAPRAFGLPSPRIVPIHSGRFIGSVADGGSCNCDIVEIVPHGNTTHTECVGHITVERVPLYYCLRRFLFWAQLVTVEPLQLARGDQV
ncbi:MAG: cyclase family protein, partial [Candidatus Kapabacteria bacterium]|nr:cyclase family protein [Candidatus Kapabacteria bacterium]MDW7996837.1 hypothetical protein [Bacteroidota bacterium]